jgi:L-ribulose-5-phosphate 3-epimerase
MATISFMSANYVAEHVGFTMTRGWAQGERATSEHFEPIESFGQRFDNLLGRVTSLGFDAMDLWTAHLSPRWATDDHVSIARDLLRKRGLHVPSLAGNFGATSEEFEASCRIAAGVGAPLLGGMTDLLISDRAALVEALEDHNLVLGVENHPEKNPAELMAVIGGGAGGRVGTTVDTGWYATQGYDAAEAIKELGELVVHVHLKDIEAPGEHVTCSFGAGCVPLERCVRALVEIGYDGTYTLEHEPENRDPSEEIRSSAALVREWLEAAQRSYAGPS